LYLQCSSNGLPNDSQFCSKVNWFSFLFPLTVATYTTPLKEEIDSIRGGIFRFNMVKCFIGYYNSSYAFFFELSLF